MFPEIVREEIFRLETRRLWLRWPMASDADDPPLPPVGGEADGPRVAPPEASTGDPYRCRTGIAGFRRDTETGTALHLALSGRGADRRAFGSVSLTPVRERLENFGLLLHVSLDPSRRGNGLMTEAVQAVVDAAFMLTDTPLVAASARVLDPAFRRVLEKCGFAYCGTGLDPLPHRGALAASDRLRLDRKAWASLKAWRIPGLVRHRGIAAEPADCAACG